MQKILNKKNCLFLMSILLTINIPIISMHAESKKMICAVHDYDIMTIKKILSQKPNFKIKNALHTSYDLNFYKITFLILKSEYIGINNKDSKRNTLIHKAIIDKKALFLMKLLNFTGTPSLNINKKNKESDTPLHTALNIVNQRSPSFGFIKILTRHPELNFSLKNRYQETPLEHAESNLLHFLTTRNYSSDKNKKARNRNRTIEHAKKIITHLALVQEYQTIIASKKTENYNQFLNNKNFNQLCDISLIALYQNNRLMIKKINALHPQSFSWLNMLYDAHLSNSIKPINFLMNQLKITAEECRYVLDCIFNTKKTITCTEERKNILYSVRKLYKNTGIKPYQPEIKKYMLDYLRILLMLYEKFKNHHIDLVHNIIEYHE